VSVNGIDIFLGGEKIESANTIWRIRWTAEDLKRICCPKKKASIKKA
jgi:hypothetical protein